MKVYRDLKLPTTRIGFTHASGSAGADVFTSRVVDSLFVGETDNIGNPSTPEEIAYGRSLPKAENRGFPDSRRTSTTISIIIRGGEHHLRELRGQRHSRCGSDLLPAVSPALVCSVENSAEGLEFINAKPVHFPEMVAEVG